jgi:sec-independent protein translocase protein TatA
MPQVGGTELLIVLAIILLFFGARRIPELGRSLGKSMSEFRKGASEEKELPRDEGTDHLEGVEAHGGDDHAGQRAS